MISVLLSRVRQTHRVDGSGGDGGRDCYFSDENGTDVYQLKSFPGRMNNARRQQVVRSLHRALRDPRALAHWSCRSTQRRKSRSGSTPWHLLQSLKCCGLQRHQPPDPL